MDEQQLAPTNNYQSDSIFIRFIKLKGNVNDIPTNNYQSDSIFIPRRVVYPARRSKSSDRATTGTA